MRYYIEDLAAHELRGPIATPEIAHWLAGFRGIRTYRLVPEHRATVLHEGGSVRPEPDYATL